MPPRPTGTRSRFHPHSITCRPPGSYPLLPHHAPPPPPAAATATLALPPHRIPTSTTSPTPRDLSSHRITSLSPTNSISASHKGDRRTSAVRQSTERAIPHARPRQFKGNMRRPSRLPVVYPSSSPSSWIHLIGDEINCSPSC
ncbi:hypothetical protein DAI22_01g236800 [Oryza sativa Japonica Group]|nr:hypothetical protein DAI22_01g236800 [Oryza sativa Japonica Group]KAF2951090.1 hypothetical protein DAI22_01g236800 [Oryza sativa Japonica Group]